MSLSVGGKFGPYEVLAPIGAGGMGEVYRARDPRLNRDVAIKVSEERYSDRFEHEARAVAALNHPNICTLYDIGPNYLVMEFIEGESPKGPMPLDEALRIARQIAEALESAHEKGIVHRDLKPANIKIKPDGTVKLLDFGLAKKVETASGDPENSPTMTRSPTHAGMILGTAAYMSPEQARGKTIDKRSDIWAFGVVLFEMLTGRRLFQGEDLTDTLASVIKGTPDLSAAPAPVRRLLESCLEKDPRNRLRDIGDWARLLEPAAAAAPPSKRAGILPWAIAAASLLGAIGIGAFAWSHFAERPQTLRLTLPTPERAKMDSFEDLPAISPDGRRVAFAAQVDGKAGIWVRDLDGTSTRLLPGTEGSTLWFWSPDSRWLAFFTARQLKKVAVTGGPALTLCDVVNGRGGTWSRDGWIVYFRFADGLFLVPDSGGIAPTRLTLLDTTASETVHRAPWFLPDGRHFLYTARCRERAKSRVYVDSIEARPGSATRREVLAVHSNVVYVPRTDRGLMRDANDGYLLFTRENTLMAQPFDAGKARTTGEAAPVAEQVDFFPQAAQGQFSASGNGTLVYTSGAAAGANVQLTWFDRTGKPCGVVGSPGKIRFATLSPSGSLVAIDREDAAGNFDIWLQDLARGTESRLTFGSSLSEHNPVWSPDGSRIGFSQTMLEIWQKAADGTGQEEMLYKDPQNRISVPKDWSRDGRYLITSLVDPRKGIGVQVVPTFGDRKAFPYLNSESNNTEVHARLSPDGRFLAYNSDELKQSEVYVQTFPEHGGKWQISTGGGDWPVWSRDGRELYFLSDDSQMMAVEVKASGNKFEVGAPKALFPVAERDQFDVGKDGRFLIRVPQAQTAGSVSVNLVVNWQSALKK